jgi:uncharacterized repeat protein (TIGR03803 family)
MTSRTDTRALWGLAAALFLGAAISIGQTFEVVHTFTAEEGSDPQSGLVQLPDGRLIGTTVGDNGTLFQMDTSGNLKTIHRFEWSFDGANPHSPLLVAADGSLFGTTLNGLFGWGGVYKFDRTNTLTVLKAFVPSTTGLNGEGATPHAPLIQVSGALSSGGTYYGVTTRGGKDGKGTIFAMDAAYNVRTLHHFSGWDGAEPFESLHYYDGFLYGTTTVGGLSNNGTIFRMSLDGSFFQTLYSFSRQTGARPEAPIICVNGMAYGTTSLGGAYDKGTVYRFDPVTHRMAVLHNFDGSDGAMPHAGLVLAHDGYLYGTTSEGGHFDFDGCTGPDCFTPSGTIFRIGTTLQPFQVIHTFNRRNGANSQSRLIEAADGALYGTTSEGGSFNRGVVFRLVFARVDEINPTSVPPNRNVAFWLKGANFQDGAAVFVGGQRALDTLVADDANISAKTPPLPPGTLQAVVVDNPDRTHGALPNALFVDFLDIPQADPYHPFVETIVRYGVSAGLPGGNFGRDLPATRGQMAVLLLRAKYGRTLYPPAATGEVFADVPATHPFAPWIEQLYREGITAGCDGGTLFCPETPMTRGQMAVAILKAEHGSAYAPPACQGMFGDVPCTSPFAPWVEQFAREGITAGCNGSGFFCPAEPATRGQTAVFLTKAFALP